VTFVTVHGMDHVARNRSHWNATSADYQRRHGDFLRADRPAWGIWQIPEEELGVLGDVRERDVLELGCGAAQWAIALARRGARVTGLDFSDAQLAHARELMSAAGVEFPLVEASATHIPLPDAAFDVVMADHGAIGFADPLLAVPEAARVLRPGGLLAFSTLTPLVALFEVGGEDNPVETLQRDYFGLHELDWGDWVEYQLPYGEWIRLFRRCGLVVEDLVELRPAPGAESSYADEVDRAWGRRWPIDHIWKLRKPG
jgi:SAM-dependent methyltransferase